MVRAAARKQERWLGVLGEGGGESSVSVVQWWWMGVAGAGEGGGEGLVGVSDEERRVRSDVAGLWLWPGHEDVVGDQGM